MVETTLDAYSSCRQMLDALKSGRISASELLEAQLRRIARIDPALNSIIAADTERARDAAREADQKRSRGESAPLLGLPVTVKESIDIEGMATTAGVAARQSHRAARDARTVSMLRAAGAVIVGKTNVCPYLADYIADNPVYGRTNSPFDAARTPGGSSGGSASVAAGLCAVDLGSDLGGSIRIPAAFCGLFGHKPSEGLVPYSGHFPGSTLPNSAVIMTAQGPIARSAKDLELMLDVLAGPDIGMDAAWKISLPPARGHRLADYRVAVLPWQEWLPVDPEIIAGIESLAQDLRAAGAAVVETAPAGFGSLREFHRMIRLMMSVIVSVRWPAEHRQQVIQDRQARDEFSHTADARGFAASAADYLQWHEQRELYRQAYRDFFREFDILLTPVSLVPPFPHPTLPVADRVFDIAGKSIGFDYLSFYPGVASLPGHGATAFPIGHNRAGLPIAAQAIGPFLEDRTPIHFAQCIEEEFGGFVPPPSLNKDLN